MTTKEFKVDRKGRVLYSYEGPNVFKRFPRQEHNPLTNYLQKNKVVIVSKDGHFYAGNEINACIVPGGFVSIQVSNIDDDLNTTDWKRWLHTELFDIEIAERTGLSNHNETRQIFRKALALLNAKYDTQQEKNSNWNLAIAILNNTRF